MFLFLPRSLVKWSLYILEFFDVSNGLVQPPPGIANPVLKWLVLWAILIKNMTRSLMINGPRSKDLRIPSWELTYPLPVWYFRVDDFPNFPFGGSRVIVPWRVGQLAWEFVTATGLPLALWGEKIQQVAPAGSAQRLAEGFFGVRFVRFVCLGYKTQKGGNPSRKLT